MTIKGTDTYIQRFVGEESNLPSRALVHLSTYFAQSRHIREHTFMYSNILRLMLYFCEASQSGPPQMVVYNIPPITIHPRRSRQSVNSSTWYTYLFIKVTKYGPTYRSDRIVLNPFLFQSTSSSLPPFD